MAFVDPNPQAFRDPLTELTLIMLTITRQLAFDAGHRIPDHQSRCRNLHGHRYVLEITLQGSVIKTQGAPDCGMVMDFAEVKTLAMRHLVEAWTMPFWSIRTTRASARFSKRCRNTKRSLSIALRPPRTSQPSHSSGSRAFMTRITASTCGLPKCVYMKRPIAGRMSCGMDTPLKTDREAYGSIRRRHMYAAHAADSRVGARIGL